VPDFELGKPLRDAAARWLNLVPAEHRHDGRESAKDALETLREHARSCPDHPLGALWVAHRHLRDPVPAVRIASLVLASEALWWLGHFEDARMAAQAAADADPASAQAGRWPSFSTRLSSPTRRSRSRVRLSNTPRRQTSQGMRTATEVDRRESGGTGGRTAVASGYSDHDRPW